MEITTKFNVNDLVQFKYNKRMNDGSGVLKDAIVLLFEVMDIQTQTCMAGTQVFYLCRGIHGITDSDFVDGKRVKKIVQFAIGSAKSSEYTSIREDELKPAEEELVALLKADK